MVDIIIGCNNLWHRSCISGSGFLVRFGGCGDKGAAGAYQNGPAFSDDPPQPIILVQDEQ